MDDTYSYLLNIVKCLICFEYIMKNHKICIECNHGFHTECLSKWVQKKSSCPGCRNKIIQTRPKTPLENNLLKTIKFPCECGFKGLLEQINIHERKCPKRIEQCVCNKFIVSEDMCKHKQTCKHIIIQCEYCDINVKRKNIEFHMKNECENRLVCCQDCKIQFTYKQYTQHICLSKQCICTCNSEKYVKCKYCKIRIKEKDLRNHYGKCAIKILIKCDVCGIRIHYKDFGFHNRVHFDEDSSNCETSDDDLLSDDSRS